MDEISSWFKQKRELLILLSLLIFLGVFSAVLYHTNTAAERKHFQIQDEHKIYLQEKNINTDLKSIVSDVLVLGGHHEMQMMVIKLNSENRDNLTGEFFRFCQDKKLYDQVRFLDKTGMEIIRVNFNNGDPTIVPKDQLQLKADRYYFSETLALGPTEIFVSPLDLNIENGEIEWPLKPMIRLGLPIFDGQGQKRGVIILNYLAEILLNDFDEILHDDFGENILLNSDGYFLKAPQSELEWGFMFEERKDRMFGHIYPDEWEQISSNQQGQFVTANGQFTFKTLYLPQGKQNMPTSSRSQSLFSEPETPGSYWKIVSRLSPMKLNENARRFFYHLILVDCVLGFLACAVCFAMTRMRQKREFMDQEMRKLSQAVEQSPASVIITDLDGTITYVNPKFTEISGYSADEAIGQNPKILKSGYASSEEYKELWKTITAGHEWRGEFKNKKKNGELHWESVSISPILSSRGDISHFIGVQEDITERKQAEERLNANLKELAESRKTALKLMEEENKSRKFAEEAAEKLKKARDELETRVKERTAELFRTNEELEEEIKEHRHAEEEILRLNVTLEKRVLERTTQLQAANKELESFSYSVSHDLRTPLRAVSGYSRILLEDYGDRLDEEGRNCLDRIQTGGNRMAEMIDALLDLSRMSRLDLQRNTVELSVLAKEIAEEIQAGHPDRHVNFVNEPDLTAEGDKNLLRQVLQNLLTNAWKFTHKRGQAKIEFGMTEYEGAPAYYVRDNGIGFDMAYVDKLFGVFQRLHGPDEFEGTGIGLANVQRIIHLHGGRVWAEGEVDQGAIFYFTLGGNGENVSS